MGGGLVHVHIDASEAGVLFAVVGWVLAHGEFVSTGNVVDEYAHPTEFGYGDTPA
jgi:hypothetical protein